MEIKMEYEYKGQSKSEFKKNYQRIIDIINKTDDINQQKKLAQIQAKRIKDEYKAINRAIVAKELEHDHLFEIFLKRDYDLGSVGKQEFREYQLTKLGI